MKRRSLGSGGLLVSELGIGTNTFGRYCDAAQSRAILDTALELGVDFIDTADVYGGGLSETYIGEAIQGRRDKFVICTKTGYGIQAEADPGGLSRRRLIARLDDSLRRLKTDHVDVYYMHTPDRNTPLAETLRTLDDLVSAGKIRYPAHSNHPGWQIAEIAGICRAGGYVEPVVSQSQWNLVERGVEAEVVPACEHFGLGMIPYSPLAGGFLTGKYRRGEDGPEGARGTGNEAFRARWMKDENVAALERYESFAAARGRTVAELAVSWLLAHPVVSSVITGVTSPDQLRSNAKSIEWELTTEELAELKPKPVA